MFKTFLTGTIVCCLIWIAQAAIDTGIQNRNVDRTIDLTSQNVKISYKITLSHKTKKQISAYTFVLPAEERANLAFISIKDSTKKEVKYVEEKISKGVTFAVNLPAPATAATPQVLYIETVLSKSITPYPTEILQSDRQLVRYFGNAYFYSPYETLTQKATIHLSSKNVESFTSYKPSSQSDTVITYGPYDNVIGMLNWAYNMDGWNG